MKKTILAVVTCAVLAVATLAPTTADARWRGRGLGLFGAAVAAIIVGSAIARHPGYYTYDDYDVDAPDGCYWARRAWRDEDGYVHYGRPRVFCD